MTGALAAAGLGLAALEFVFGVVLGVAGVVLGVVLLACDPLMTWAQINRIGNRKTMVFEDDLIMCL